MIPWRGLRNLPKEVWAIAITTLINRAGTMVVFFLTYYLRQKEFGFSLGRVGFIIALFGLGSLLMAPISGSLSDRVGALQVMKFSLVLSGAILLIYPFAHSFLLVGFLTLLWAVTAESFRPASDAILIGIALEGDAEEAIRSRKAALTLNRLAMNLGFVVGPAVASILTSRGQWNALFVIDGATSILAFVYLSVALKPSGLRSDSSESHTTESVTIPAPTSRAIEDPQLRYFLLAVAPALMVLFLELGPLQQFMKIRLGIGESLFGYLISLNALLVILFELPLNLATGHWSYRRSLAWGAILLGIGFGAVAFASSFALVALTVVIWTFGEMFLLPNMVGYVGSIAPEKRRGGYVGLYSMVFNLCMSVAPALGILALVHFRGEVLWSVAFFLGAISAVMMLRLGKGATKPA